MADSGKLYIHYWFENYLSNGVSYGSGSSNTINPENEMETALSKAEKESLDKAMYSTNSSKAKELEDQLNFFQNPKENRHLQGNYDITDAQMVEIQNAIEEKMREAVSFKEIDFQKGVVEGVTQSGKTSSVQARGLKNSQAGVNRAFSVRAFEKRVDRLDREIQRIIASGDLGKDGAEASLRFEKLEKEWKNYKESVLDAQEIKMVSQGSGAVRTQMESFQKEIKEIGNLIYAGNLKSTAQGLLGEYIVGAVATIIDNMEEKNTSDLIKNDFIKGLENKKVMTGGNILRGETKFGSFTGFDKTFDKYHGSNLSKKMQYKDENEITYEAAPSQSKLDVAIRGIGAVSVKNYNFSGGFAQKAGISLVSGTSLQYMLMTEPMFTAHYLNIVAETGGGTADSGRSNFRETANRLLRRLLFLKAIVGTSRFDNQTGGTENVNLFALNDSSTGRWRVYEVSKLLKTIAKDVDKYVTVDGISNDFTIQNRYVQNAMNTPFVNAQIRVNNIITNLNYKINVHAKLDLFS